jgi:hypothetical protein
MRWILDFESAVSIGMDVRSRYLVESVQIESFRPGCSVFTNEFVWYQSFEGRETAAEVADIDEVSKMPAHLIVVVMVIAVNGFLFDGVVREFDLAISPRMPWFGEPVIDVVSGASALRGLAPEQFSFCPYHSEVSWPSSSRRLDR